MSIRPRGAIPLVVLLGLAVIVTSVIPLLTKHPLDLAVYRLGGSAVLRGTALYSQRIGPFGFTYPPFAALVAGPFAVVSFGFASAMLAVGSFASLSIFVKQSAGNLLARVCAAPSACGVVALLGLVCCAPVRGTFWNGQVNLVLAALVITDLQGVRLRGVGVGLAAAIKLTPMIFILYLLWCGRRREAANAAGAFLSVSALAAAVLPSDSARFWLHQLSAGTGESAGFGNEARTSNQSIHGLVLRLFGSDVSSAVWLAPAAVAALAGLHIAARLSREGRETFAIGVVGVTGCVASPVSWVHHWVWALPWLVGLAESVRRPATVTWAACVAIVVVGWDKLPLGLLPTWAPAMFVAHNDLVLCAVATGLTGLWSSRPDQTQRINRSLSHPAKCSAAFTPRGVNATTARLRRAGPSLGRWTTTWVRSRLP